VWRKPKTSRNVNRATGQRRPCDAPATGQRQRNNNATTIQGQPKGLSLGCHWLVVSFSPHCRWVVAGGVAWLLLGCGCVVVLMFVGPPQVPQRQSLPSLAQTWTAVPFRGLSHSGPLRVGPCRAIRVNLRFALVRVGEYCMSDASRVMRFGGLAYHVCRMSRASRLSGTAAEDSKAQRTLRATSMTRKTLDIDTPTTWHTILPDANRRYWFNRKTLTE